MAWIVGSKAVSAGTATAIGTSTKPFKAVVVKSRQANGTIMYVGDSSVSATAAIALEPGESFPFQSDDRDLLITGLYVDCANGTCTADFYGV